MSGVRQGRTVAIVFGLLLASFAAYQQFKLPVVLPILLERFHYDRTLAGGFMSVYALVGLLVSLPLGRLIQRQGPFRPILAALALFVLAALIPLIAPQLGWLMLASRALEGVAFGVLAISGPVLANAHASPRQLPLVAGFAAAWIPVGQLSAILAAPLAFALADWRLLWWLGIALSCLFACWCLALRRDGVLTDHRRADPRRVETVAQPPLGTPLARQDWGLVLTGGVFMLWSCQYFAYMTWLPQYLVEVHGLDVSDALLGYVIPVGLVMIFCILTGLLLRAGLSIAGLLIAALVAQVAVWALLPVTGGGWQGLLSLVAYGIGAGVVPACLFGLPSALLRGGHDTARAFGIVMTGRNIGVLAGPVLLAQAFTWIGSWDLAAPIFGTITFFCLPLALCLAVVLHRQKGQVGESGPVRGPGGSRPVR